MKRILFIVMMMVTLSSYAQIEVRGKATLEKINFQDGKVIDGEKYDRPTYFSISEKYSSFMLGDRQYFIDETTVKDSVVVYIAANTQHKEFIYCETTNSLTQRNIKWLSHGIETWFVYTLIKE